MMAEAIAMAGIIVPAVVAHIAPLFVEYVKRKVNERQELSLADLNEVLKEGLERLLSLEIDNDNKVWNNITQKDASEDYKHWKKRVSKIKEKVASLNAEHKAENQTDNQRHGQRGSDKNQGTLKNNIKRELDNVIKLLGEEYPKEILVEKRLVEKVIEEPGVPLIEKYKTLRNAFEEIKDLLENDGVKCVALRGQKGTGKTTIMQHLNNHFCDDNVDDKKFEVVIFIKVTANEKTDIKILHKIADQMKVDRGGDGFREVSRNIQMVLNNKRYLLILDGMSHAVDGIWEKLNISKDKKDSKLVITTQYPPVWKSKYVSRIVPLEQLSPDEALNMFHEIVGDSHPSLVGRKRIVQQVCKKFCCCLPLLVDRIAKSFIYHVAYIDWNKAVIECIPWPQVADRQSALNERMPQLQDDEEDLTDLSSNLEICFRLLADQNKQKCFLFASLYPANTSIYTDYFVECCIVQGFLGEVDATTYSELRRIANGIVLSHLVNVAFLEEEENMRYVKMNDLYRHLAFHISTKYLDLNCTIYVDNEEHDGIPIRLESWQKATWASMINSKRNSLPTNQNCGSPWTVLLVQNNERLVEISSDYFQSMSNLLVLDLYGTKISKLPSLKGLTRLKAFYLKGCSDLKIDPYDQIQLLENLEVFDIRGTRVNFVPCLKKLRCLRISYTASCDYHKISELHNLEELIVEVDEKQFQQRWYDSAKDYFVQIALQRNLSFRWYWTTFGEDCNLNMHFQRSVLV